MDHNNSLAITECCFVTAYQPLSLIGTYLLLWHSVVLSGTQCPSQTKAALGQPTVWVPLWTWMYCSAKLRVAWSGRLHEQCGIVDKGFVKLQYIMLYQRSIAK